MATQPDHAAPGSSTESASAAALSASREKQARNFEILGALALAAVAILFVVYGLDHSLGTLNRPGAALFPVATGAILIALAVSIVATRTWSAEAVPAFALRPVLAVGLAIFSWITLVEWLGLVPATVALVVISSLARRPLRIGTTLVLAAALAALASAIFLWGLQIPLRAIAW